jgi:hypothetical protein
MPGQQRFRKGHGKGTDTMDTGCWHVANHFPVILHERTHDDNGLHTKPSQLKQLATIM